MTGTGTQTDPFLVDNWTDFMTIDTNSAEIYVRWADTGNKVIKINDFVSGVCPPDVNFSGICINCPEIRPVIY